MTKRMVSLLMALVLMVGILAVPAMAASQGDEGIMPHGSVCPICRGNCIVSITNEWRAESRSSCVHGKNGYDIISRKYVITKTSCTGCGEKRTSEARTSETMRVCAGY